MPKRNKITMLGAHRIEYEDLPIPIERNTLYESIINIEGATSPNFMELLANMNEEEQRHVGDVLMPPEEDVNNIMLAIQDGMVVCVCDGSLKDRRGSHAWILASPDLNERLQDTGP
jgi:hypothetical protein